MMFALLSMAGIPPFVGFYAKLFILQQLVASGFVVIAVISVVFAVISAYYYLSVIKSMYFEKSEKTICIEAPMDMKLVLSINGVLVLLLGIFPNFWIELSKSLF
jgi:NADH-quinone oxidoreductase subunit N